jgi:hypothetical protein
LKNFSKIETAVAVTLQFKIVSEIYCSRQQRVGTATQIVEYKTAYVYVRRYLITCGSDGDVRIYDGFEDDDPESFRAGENVTAVTYKVLYIGLKSALGTNVTKAYMSTQPGVQFSP